MAAPVLPHCNIGNLLAARSDELRIFLRGSLPPCSACAGVGRLRAEPAAGWRAAAAAGGDGGQAGRARRHRPGRICRPLRRGRFGRGARPRLRLSRTGAFHATARWSSRATCCSPSTSARSRTPSRRRAATLAQAKANLAFTEADLDARPAAGARHAPSPSRPSSSARRPTAAPQASVAAQRGGGAPGRARSRVHRAARAGRRPHRRPPRVARQSRHRRRRRQHHAARHHRVDSIRSASNSPSMRRRICATSASPSSGKDVDRPRRRRRRSR